MHSFKAATFIDCEKVNILMSKVKVFHILYIHLTRKKKKAVQSPKIQTDNQPEVLQFSQWKQSRLQSQQKSRNCPAGGMYSISAHVSQNRTPLSRGKLKLQYFLTFLFFSPIYIFSRQHGSSLSQFIKLLEIPCQWKRHINWMCSMFLSPLEITKQFRLEILNLVRQFLFTESRLLYFSTYLQT